jgi:hypothetical protein
LFDYANDDGSREVDIPFARELARQQEFANAIRVDKAKFVIVAKQMFQHWIGGRT